MFNLFDDDEEETPSITHYNVYDHRDRKIGECRLMSDGQPDHWQLMAIPIFKTLWAYWSGLQWNFNDLSYYAPTKAPVKCFYLKAAYGKKSDVKNPLADYCSKCKAKGVFKRTALVCPICNGFLGGF